MNKQIEQLKMMFDRLSQRERSLAFGAAGAAGVFITVFVVVSVQSSLAERRARIEVKRQGLARVVQLSSGFRQAEAERRRLESKLRGSSKVSLVSLMEELSKNQDVSISNMTPRRPTTKGQVVEETLDVSLQEITIEKLAAIINGLQRSPHMVKVRKLRVRRKFNEKEKVDATLTVATYSLSS